MKTVTNTMKELAYNIAIGHIIDMNIKLQKGKEYSDSLNEMIGVIVKKEMLTDIYFNEYWTIGYNCLWLLLTQAEMREEYEVCGTIKRIIENEEDIYKAWCLTLPDEEQQDALDELEYTQLAIKMERDGESTIQ